jgi:hypothetical protein
MSFVHEFNRLPIAALHDASLNASEEAVRRALSNPQPGLADFADDFVIAWSAAEAGKRPEIWRLVKRLEGTRV